jgi:hypothetical protein
MKPLLVTFMACLGSSSLLAESITNQELLKSCKDGSEARQNFCYGFVISAANAAQFYRNIVDTEGQYIDICFPSTVSNKDMVDLYIAWAEKNTEASDDPAFIGVSTSFSTKYSCAEKEASTSKVVLSPVSSTTPPPRKPALVTAPQPAKPPVTPSQPPKPSPVTPPSPPHPVPHPTLDKK